MHKENLNISIFISFTISPFFSVQSIKYNSSLASKLHRLPRKQCHIFCLLAGSKAWKVRSEMKQIQSFYYLSIQLYRVMTAPLQQCLRMESASDVQYIQCAVIESLVVEKESVINIHKQLSNVYGSAIVDRSTVGHWAKRVIASDTEEQSSMICFPQAILSWFSVLKYCSVLIQ